MTQLAGDRCAALRVRALLGARCSPTSRRSRATASGCCVFDDEVRAFVPPPRGPRRARVACATRSCRCARRSPSRTTRRRSARSPRASGKRALVVLFTDVIDVRASQALVALTGRSASRHLPLVVALRNDALVAAALPAGDAPSPRAVRERGGGGAALGARGGAGADAAGGCVVRRRRRRGDDGGGGEPVPGAQGARGAVGG